MERLKLVNVLKSTFLGSEFHTFTFAIIFITLLYDHISDLVCRLQRADIS